MEKNNLTKTDLAILSKIHSSNNPDAMRDHIRYLLANPLKVREELAKLAALPKA